MRKKMCICLILMSFLACEEQVEKVGAKDGAKQPIDWERGETDASSRVLRLEGFIRSLPSVEPFHLDVREAEEMAGLSLSCISREYPNKPANIIADETWVRSPRQLHPVFFGCFDWHSAVHGHWALVRLLKTKKIPNLESRVRKALSEGLAKEKISMELTFFDEPDNKLYERPYGWGWMMRLFAELHTFDDPDAKKWTVALAPLASKLRDETIKYFEVLSAPVRSGTHQSSAYAMVHMWDYANAIGDEELKKKLKSKALQFYENDKDCPVAYEPSGEDFISPCLVEAEMMSRIMNANRFEKWLNGFFPEVDTDEFVSFKTPARVLDKEDPRIGHLIGLSFQRASSFSLIADALSLTDPRKRVFEKLAAIHLNDGMRQMSGSGYGGEHWLASFAIYAATESGPYEDIQARRTRWDGEEKQFGAITDAID